MTDKKNEDGLIQIMRKAGLPLTRENYINLAYANDPPAELSAEQEAELPEILRAGLDLYAFIGVLEAEFGGEVEPSEENEDKAYLSFDDDSLKEADPDNSEDAGFVQVAVRQWGETFSIAIEVYHGEQFDDLDVELAAEAITFIKERLEIWKTQKK